MSALLPCPFCGPGESHVSLWHDDVSKRWRVGCGRCGCSTGTSPRDTSQAPAIESWNRRAPIAIQGDESRADALEVNEEALKHAALAGRPDLCSMRAEHYSNNDPKFADAAHGVALDQARRTVRTYLNVMSGISSQARLDGAGTPEVTTVSKLRDLAKEFDWCNFGTTCAKMADTIELGTSITAVALSAPPQEPANGPAKSERTERGTQ